MAFPQKLIPFGQEKCEHSEETTGCAGISSGIQRGDAILWMGLRNPAPVESGGKHPIIYIGFQPSQVVPEFFHR
jgi:hypothetical protein